MGVTVWEDRDNDSLCEKVSVGYHRIHVHTRTVAGKHTSFQLKWTHLTYGESLEGAEPMR